MDIQSKTRRTLTVALLAATLVSGTAFACYTCYPGKLVVKKTCPVKGCELGRDPSFPVPVCDGVAE